MEKIEHCEHAHNHMLDLSGLNKQERNAVIVLVMGILRGDLMLKQRDEFSECLKELEKKKCELEQENAILKRLLREGACIQHTDGHNALKNTLSFVAGKFGDDV